MINHIRKVLLIVVLMVVGLSGYNLITKMKNAVPLKEIELMTKGVDIKIQNFKIVHEVMGNKEWELLAETALVNHEQDTAKLKVVEFRLHQSQNRKFHVWADSGVFKNQSQEIDLEGHVKVLGEPRLLTTRLGRVNPVSAGTEKSPSARDDSDPVNLKSASAESVK